MTPDSALPFGTGGALFGHDRAEAVLAEAIRADRLPHAVLLAGPAGIGKASLAFRLARCLLRGPAAMPAAPAPAILDDGRAHPADRLVASGAHPDLMLVERGYDERRKRRRAEIVIDDIRALSRFFALTASGGGWRVAIIDAADEMNRNAANAMLKLLEEPPPRSALILVGHAPGRLPATIRSRCRLVRLSPLDDGAMRRWLDQQGVDPAGREIPAILTVAEGRPGRALGLLNGHGLTALRDAVELLAPAPDLDIARLHAVADDWNKPAGEGEADRFADGVAMLDWWTARALRLAACGEAPDPPLHPAEAAAVTAFATRLGAAAALARRDAMLSLFARGEALNLDRRQMLLQAFTALAA